MRQESVVPTQALVLMNDEFVEEQAGFLARRAQAAGNDLQQTIERIFLLAVSRSPSTERLREATEFVHTREHDGDRASALTDLAYVLFNSSEFLYVP